MTIHKEIYNWHTMSEKAKQAVKTLTKNDWIDIGIGSAVALVSYVIGLKIGLKYGYDQGMSDGITYTLGRLIINGCRKS